MSRMTPMQRRGVRATRRRGDGRRGWRARWALRQLARAGDGGDTRARIATWHAWMHRPDDELWELLTRWRYPGNRPEAILGAGVADQPRASRQAIGEFCVRRGLFAGDDSRRIELYALTGLTARLRAADPDGTRLAFVYLAASERRRGPLRRALAEDGELDLVRALGAGGPRGWDDLSRSERTFLLDALTGRQDWPALWRLVQQMPVPEAAMSMRRMHESWAPDDAGERALLAVLARASRQFVTSPRWADPAAWPRTLSGDRDQALRALAARPLRAASPADLVTATRLLGTPGLGPARAFVQTVRDCLDVRFGTDVALGSPVAGHGPDDIALPSGG